MPNLGANFYPKLIQISQELNINPKDLLVIMVSESGLNPGAINNQYKGSGLLGFLDSTLKSFGYNGDYVSFSKLSGEEQLPYVKMAIQNLSNLSNGNLKSAAQIYAGNFFPVSLKLPGIRALDFSTKFVEKNPELENGYSKKYYDVGVKLNPKVESNAYTTNYLFHGSTIDAITLGDMQTRVNNVKRMTLYQNAVKQLENAGYVQSPQTDMMTTNKGLILAGLALGGLLLAIKRKFV